MGLKHGGVRGVRPLLKCLPSAVALWVTVDTLQCCVGTSDMVTLGLTVTLPMIIVGTVCVQPKQVSEASCLCACHSLGLTMPTNQETQTSNLWYPKR